MTPQRQLSVVAPSAPAVGVRVADQIVRTLREWGVNTIFGVPGGAISAVYDAVIDEPGIQVINTRHECTAVYACGCPCACDWLRRHRTRERRGPGVTNTITGIASCFCDGLPVLVIGGEVPRKNFGRGALQEGSPYHLNLAAMLKHA